MTETNPAAKDNAAVMRRIVGHMGTGGRVRATDGLHAGESRPAGAAHPADQFRRRSAGGGTAGNNRSSPIRQWPPTSSARGWGYAMVGYQDIQPDRLNTFNQGVIGQTLAAGQAAEARTSGEPSARGRGASAASSTTSRPTRSIDAKKIAVHGHSRLGKTVLWASALDERIAAVYSSCSGEMGAALARRDWGETVDDMAQNFPYQFAGNFQKYAGHWNDMPVDAHMLIALSAPRPVFITGGTADQWADPVGEFKADVAAGPVYRLLGKNDLGTTELPPLDTPLTKGDHRLALSHGWPRSHARRIGRRFWSSWGSTSEFAAVFTVELRRADGQHEETKIRRYEEENEEEDSEVSAPVPNWPDGGLRPPLEDTRSENTNATCNQKAFVFPDRCVLNCAERSPASAEARKSFHPRERRGFPATLLLSKASLLRFFGSSR